MTPAHEAKQVFPVGFLVRGRTCTVIGGGKIALRKVTSLLEVKARVVVVSPEVVDELRVLAEEGRIAHMERSFEPEDVRGSALVFAATNDYDVNVEVLKHCRVLKVCGCSVDKSWVEGDFVTPAAFRKGDLTVSVTTGGKSCRRSKLVKDSLARHVEMVDTAELLVMGTSHKYLSIEQREPFHLAGHHLEHVGNMVMHVWGVHEFALINTCNRIELVAVVTAATAVESALKRMLRFDELGDDGFYIKRGTEAFSHLAVLASGLLSQVPGEHHIVAQVKDAFASATARGWASGMLQQWLSSSLHISKDIRRETASLLHHREIEDLVLQYTDAELPGVEAKRVLVLGTGVIGRNLVDRLAAEGHRVTWCFHRNEPELRDEEAKSISLCSMNALCEHLASVDVVLCATASAEHVLHMGHAPFFDQERCTVVIDLAMPRNVSPDLNGLAEMIRVVDLDDMKHWYRRERADMARVFEVSNEITEQHQDMYDKLIDSFQGRNTRK